MSPRARAITANSASPEVRAAFDLLQAKWTLGILDALLRNDALRFGELQRALGRVSPKMLVARLHELEEGGYTTRTHYPEIPPRVEYALTEKGRLLAPVIEAIRAYAEGAG